MIVKKVETKETFTPITFETTLETQEELNSFMALVDSDILVPDFVADIVSTKADFNTLQELFKSWQTVF